MNQTFNKYEIIVVDDGSTDDTCELLKHFNEKIIYQYQGNRGRSAARNTGIRQAHGKYIAFLDADDIWLPDRLARQIPILEAHPDVQLIYSKAKIIDGNGIARQVWGHPSEMGEAIQEPGNVFDQLVLGNFIPILTVTLRRSALDQSGLFDERLSYPEDWDLWLRISKTGNIYYIPETLACYRIVDEDRTARLSASPEIVDQQIYVIDKIYGKQVNSLTDIEKLGRAWIYARAAMAAVQINDIVLASRHWSEAINAYPMFLEADEVQQVAQKAVYTAHKLEEGQGHAGAIQYLKSFSASLPFAKHRQDKIKSEILNEYYLDTVFEASNRKDYATVRKFLLPCLSNSTDWLTNRALWKITLQAMIHQ